MAQRSLFTWQTAGVVAMSSGAAAELAFALARGQLLDVAFQADIAVTRVLAAYFGRDAQRAAYLEASVIGPQSVNQRLKHLKAVMEWESWHDDFPFIAPVLDRLFDRRNRFAHSAAYGAAERRRDEWLSSWWTSRRSEVTVEEVSLVAMRELVRLAEVVVRIDLEALWVRAVPESYWLER